MKRDRGIKNIKLIIAFLLIVIILFGFGICMNKDRAVTNLRALQKKIFLPEELEGWNLSLLMYDSAIDNGMISVQEDVWNATNENEHRTVKVQVNLTNVALTRDYARGELSISVDSLGKLAPQNEDRTQIQSPTTISADSVYDSNKEYDWTYKFDYSTQKYIFTNNNLIEAGSTFESTIQMAFVFWAPNVLNGADVTINASLNEELNSVNTLNFKYTSNKKIGTNTLTFSKLTSYDGLGDNASNYYWAKFKVSGKTTGENVRGYIFDSYVDLNVPEGCNIYDKNMNEILPDENDIYKLLNNGAMGYGLGPGIEDYPLDSAEFLYIRFPKELYGGQIIDLTSNWCGKYMDSQKVKGDTNKELETIASITQTIDLSEYEIVLNSDLYTVKKKTPDSLKKAYSKIIDEQKGEDITFCVSGITYYNGNKYKVKYGDDVLYISNTQGGYIKLTDDEYCFKSVGIPRTLYNGNAQTIESDKYNIDLYVRYRGANSYTKYGETFKNGTTKTFSFNEDEFVVGWYVEIYDLEESLKFSTSGDASYGISTKVHIQKSSGLSETGKIYNFDYMQVYNLINDEYTLINEPLASSYSTAITNELAEYDMANYGVYLQRNSSSKDYGADYVAYNISNSFYNSSYDNDYFYFKLHFVPSLSNYTTGVNNFDGYNCYFVLPEGTELDATADELYDFIIKQSGATFASRSFKPDGTQFTYDEMYLFFKEHLTISIDSNYQNTGKTWIWIKEDFGDITFDIYSASGLNTHFPVSYKIPVKVPYESYFTHGSTYKISGYIAPLKDEEPFTYNQKKDTNDIDNDGDTTDYYSASYTYTVSVVPAISSYQEASKSVWTEETENRYLTEFVVAKNGGDYKYKLKVRTGSNEITNLIIYDNLENASDDWKGTFVGIDTELTNSQGFNPTLYVSNDRNAGTLEDDPTNWRLYDATADNSEVKSVAIDYGNSIIPAGFLTFVLIDMKAPEDPNIKTIAKNISYTKWNALDLNGNIVESVTGVSGNTVHVGLGKAEHDIIVQKVWEDNNNEYHVRPSSVVVHLLRNGVDVGQAELNEDNDWKYTFNNIRIYDDEYEKYNYTIYEEEINLYEPNIIYEELAADTMSRTFTITNTIKENELFKYVVGNKIWDDNNNAKNKRPTSVTIKLYRDNEQIETTTTDASKNWTYSFNNLLKWKNNTEEYNYTVEEVEDEHYSGELNTILQPTSGAVLLRFNSSSKTEGVNYDYVEIYYKLNDQTYKIGRWGGNSIANIEVTIPTNDFYIYWRTDRSGHNYYGFKIDYINPINYEGEIIGTTATLPNYSSEEISNTTFPESEHVYSDNINKMWHYKFNSRVTVNITNTYKLIPSTVLVHHYIEGTTTSLADDELIDGYVWDNYTTFPSTSIPTYYQVVSTPTNATGEFSDTQKVVTYFYKLKKYNFRVEYYYNRTRAESKTENLNATYGESINTYENKIEDGYEFDYVEGIPLVISENENLNVIKVYYTKRADLSYTIHYKEQGTNKTIAEDKYVGNQVFDTTINEAAKDIDGYDKLEPTTTEITVTTGTNEYTFYYKKKILNYRVEYYYNKNIDNSKTDTLQAPFHNEITEYTNKIESGYILDRVDGLPLVISDNEEENVIRVYYKIDETQTKDLSYTVAYYKNNNWVKEDTVVVEDTVQVTQPNTLQLDRDLITDEGKYYGYILDCTKPLQVPDRVKNGAIINVFYIPDKSMTKTLRYTVEYYKEGDIVINDTKSITQNVQVLQPDTLELDKSLIDNNKYDGYRLDQTDPENIPDEVNSGDVIKVYYTKRTDLQYTIHYKEYGTNESLADDKVEKNKTYGNFIDESAIDIPGYEKLDPSTTQMEITTGTNEYTFYYKKAKFNYTVEYYYNDVKDDGKTDTIEATYLDVITRYEEKSKDGYIFKHADGIPLTISSNESENTIKVYYIIDDGQRKTLRYTVEYYIDGHIQENDVQNEEKEVHVLADETMQVDKTEINTTDKYEKCTFEYTDPQVIPDIINTGGVIKVYYSSIRTITIKHIDRTAGEVLKTDVRNGKDGQAITTRAETFDGYTCVEKPEVEEYTFNSTNPTITYYYAMERKVVIMYYDPNTDKEISEEVMLVGLDGEEYSIEDTKKEIPNYTLVKEPNSSTGTFQENNESIIYYYAKNTQVVVKYVDKDTGEELTTSQIIKGYVGKGYETEKENIDGYTYVSSTDNTSGKMKEDVVEVVYYYTKPVEKTYSSFTINYVDIDTGKTIKTSKVITDQEVGTIIYAKALITDIDNYTYEDSDNDSIVLKAGADNTINLYYKKNTEKEETKIEPKDESKVEPKTEPKDDNTVEPKTETQTNQKVDTIVEPKTETTPKKNTNTKVILQTDNAEKVRVKNTHKSNTIIIILGISFIFIGCAIVVVYKIKHKEEKEFK